jgi:guanosine-3',5'-bis(diphosphate) 3'-pyrophosphohydrolase
MDELYASIGYGGITITKVLNKVKDEAQKIRATSEKFLKRNMPKKLHKSQSGVIVEGIDNCLIKFARCCTPIPGDDIIGFVTKGYGVSIHRKDCINVQSNYNSTEKNSRWVNVWWDEEQLTNYGRFNTALQISTKSRVGLLADIVSVLSNAHINVQEINAKDLDDGYAVTNLVIAVSGVNQLDNIMNKLKNIKGVINIIRNSNG